MVTLWVYNSAVWVPFEPHILSIKANWAQIISETTACCGGPITARMGAEQLIVSPAHSQVRYGAGKLYVHLVVPAMADSIHPVVVNEDISMETEEKKGNDKHKFDAN